MATAPTYVFRDDLEAERQRQADASAATGQPTQPTAQTQTQPVTPAAQPLPGAAPKPPAQASNPFEAFGKALEAQAPFKQQVQQNVQTQLANPYQAADAANAAARDRLAREANAAQEENRGAAITAYGGYQSGQAKRAVDEFRDKRLLNQQAFELDAAANRAQVGEQVRSNAIGQGTNLLGQDQQAAATGAGLLDSAASRASQEGIAYAGLAQNERQMAQQASQFKSQQDFTAAMTEKGYAQDAINRAWQAAEAEKARAFQGGQSDLDRALASSQFAETMGLNRQQLAETIRQFNTKEAFDRWAVERGISAQEANNLWQSRENDKARETQERIVDKQLALDASKFNTEQDFKRYALERGYSEEAVNRAWQSDEATKERQSRETIANSQIGSQERMLAYEQTFQAAEADKNRTLESMLSTDRIKAQYQLAEMDQTFQERMQATGYIQTKDLQAMRQDFEKSLQDSGIAADMAKQLADQQFTALQAQNDRVFNATQNEMQRAWETGERIGAQDYTTSIKQLEFKQQDLMQEREAALAKGLQTQQIDAEIQRTGMQIASQELMSAAQLAQQDQQFREEFMLKYDISREELRQNQMRLDEDIQNGVASRNYTAAQTQAIQQTLQSQSVQNAMEIAAFGMEMGNGSPEAMAPFVAAVGGALEKALKDQGVNLTSEEIAKMLAPVATTTGAGTTTGAAAGSNDAIQAAKDVVMDLKGSLPASVDMDKVNATVSAFGTTKPGTQVTGKVFEAMAALPGGAANTKYNPADRTYPNPTLTTQAGGDYFNFATLISQGLTEKQAFDIASNAIGADRMKASYKALTGKDWAG